MDSEADKIKYWQYKLNQKQKNSKQKESKTKAPKPKTPEKLKKHNSIISENNFITTTIEKLKNLLEDNSQKKTKEIPVHSTKHSKDLSSYRATQYELFKKCKKTESDKRMKSSSMLQLKKDRKGKVEMPAKKEKQSPSKSRSRSKSLKFKVDKLKKQKPKIVEDKSSPSRKISKKKSVKTTKSTTQKFYQTLEIPNFEEDSSWKKQLMETMVIHRNKNDESPEEEQKIISNFRVWEEFEEKMYNVKNKKSKIICSYLKGFASYAKYAEKKNIFEGKNDHSGAKTVVSFKTMVKNQEQKLLELKQCLFDLKKSKNVNESLQLLIKKVNQNIANLHNLQRQDSKSSFEQKEEFYFKNEDRKSKHKQIYQKEKEGSEKLSRKDVNESVLKNIQEEIKPVETLEVHSAPICLHDQSSLNYSHQEKSPNLNGFPSSAKQSQPSFTLKEESSSLLLDSKFLKIQLEKAPLQNEQLIHPLSYQEHLQADSIVRINQSDEDLLISNEKMNHILDQQPVVPTINSNIQQKKQYSLIKIDEESQEQHQHPIFQRSPIHNQSNSSNPPQFDLINLETSNQSLICSINTILSSHKRVQNDYPCFVQQGVRINERNELAEQLLYYLIQQFLQDIYNYLPEVSKKIVEKYNNDVLDIVEQQSEDENSQRENIAPIDATDAYVLALAERVIHQAYSHSLLERISKPLGVPSIVTLKCIRRFACSEEGENIEEEPFFDDSEQDMFQQYSEVIDTQLFQLFEEKFSPDSTNPCQMIFNRCVYEALNLLLDEFRPFGSKGMPGICFPNSNYIPPKEKYLISKMKSELNHLTEIKMGLLSQCQKSQFQLTLLMSKTLELWKNDVIRYIQKQMNYNEQDDTIQRYQLMMKIQEEIIAQEAIKLQTIRLKKMLCEQ